MRFAQVSKSHMSRSLSTSTFKLAIVATSAGSWILFSNQFTWADLDFASSLMEYIFHIAWAFEVKFSKLMDLSFL